MGDLPVATASLPRSLDGKYRIDALIAQGALSGVYSGERLADPNASCVR
jgi:hypothetical protein